MNDDIRLLRQRILNTSEEEKWSEETVAFLIRELQNTDTGIRDAACAVLRERPDSGAAALLVPLLAHEIIDIRNMASELLIDYGEASLPELLAGFASADGDMRKFIVDILGRIGAREAVPLLRQALDDSEPNVAVSAAEALGHIAATEAVPDLIAHYHDFDGMQPVVVEALGAILTPEAEAFLLDLLEKESLYTCYAILDALQNSDNTATARHLYDNIFTYRDELKTDILRTVFLILLKNDEALEIREGLLDLQENFFELLEDDDFAFRSELLRILPVSFLERTPRRLLGLLATEEQDFLQAVSEKLQQCRKTTIETLVREGRGTLTIPALLGLLKALVHHDSELVQPLLEQLGSVDDAEVQLGLVQLVADHPTQGGIDFITKLLGHADDIVQQAAYYVLSAHADSVPIEIFENGLNSSDSMVREQCLETIARIDPEKMTQLVVAWLQEDDRERIHLALRIVEKYPGYVACQSLFHLLDHEEADIRVATVRALAKIGHEEVYSQLEFLVNDRDAGVRRAALQALMLPGKEQVLPVLDAALDDNDVTVRIAGIEAIERYGLEQYVQRLYDFVVSEHRLLQIRAIQALLRLRGRQELQQIREKLQQAGQPADFISELKEGMIHDV